MAGSDASYGLMQVIQPSPWLRASLHSGAPHPAPPSLAAAVGSARGGSGYARSGVLPRGTGFSKAGQLDLAEEPDGPDLVLGPVTGYRWWTLAAPCYERDPLTADEHWPRDLLRGQMAEWRPGLNTAECKYPGGPRHDPGQVPFGSCGCVSPGTRVLTADLRWVPAGDLAVGEHLLAFDEYPADPGYQHTAGRKYRDAVVASVDRDRLPCWDLEFDDGTKVRVSSDHRWLCTAGLDGAHWVETAEMRRGDLRASHVVKPFTPWETVDSRDAGYLAAAFDGEGNLFQHKKRYQFHVAFTQAENPMLAEVERCLKELDIQFVHSVAPRGYNKPLRVDGSPRLDMHRLTVSRRADWLRVLGAVRPLRLLPKFRPDVLGRLNLHNQVRLVGKTYAGYQEVVKLGTTAGTYFAEGLASHNCGHWAYWVPQPCPLHRPGTVKVLGVIRASGKVLIGDEGFRAARARLLAVHLPFTLAVTREAVRRVPRPDTAGALARAGFTGKVISWGRQDPDGELETYRRDVTPAEDPEGHALAEAWMAVIGDRISQMYPGVRVLETRDALLRLFPPDARYAPRPGSLTGSPVRP